MKIIKKEDNKIIIIQLKDFKDLEYKDKLYTCIIIDITIILVDNYNKFFYKF